MDRSAEVQKLKQIALERYHLDGGTMYECTDDAEYIELIIEYGTAEAAWAAELELCSIRKEYATECNAY